MGLKGKVEETEKMLNRNKTGDGFIKELQKLQQKIAELEAEKVQYKQAREVEKALLFAEKKYRNLVEKAGIAIILDDREGNYKYANRKCAEIFGYSVEEMRKQSIRSVVHPGDLERVLTFQRRRLEGKKAPSRYEFRGVRKDGAIIYLEVDSAALREGKDIIGTGSYIRDITERKQAEEALRESEGKYKNLVENISDVIYETDDIGRLTYISPNIKALSGYASSELNGRALFEMAVPEDQRKIRARFGGAKQRIGEPIEFRIRTRSSKLIWVRTLSKPILENKMFRGARGILSDISRRKTAEEKLIRYQEKLRSLASRMTMVEEAERLRIASFLHDNIAQKMALAKIKLEQIPASNIQGGDLKTLNEAFNFVDDSIRDLRSLTFDLSPPILYKLGLGPALEWLAEETRKKYGLAVEFQRVEGPGKIDGRLSSILFQCARELLMNIVKHARAKRAMISFRQSRQKVQIRVEDDGMGFDIDLLRSSSLQSSGFGLFSIQERLAEFQGRMIIKSETGAGTRALLSAPLGRKSNSSSFE